MIELPITKEKLLELWFRKENWDRLCAGNRFDTDAGVYDPYVPTLRIGNIILETGPCRTMERPFPHAPYQEVDGIRYRFRAAGTFPESDKKRYYDFCGTETEQFGFQSTFEYFLSHSLPEAMPKPQKRVRLSKGGRIIEFSGETEYLGHKTKAHYWRFVSPEWRRGTITEIVRRDPQYLPCGVTVKKHNFEEHSIDTETVLVPEALADLVTQDKKIADHLCDRARYQWCHNPSFRAKFFKGKDQRDVLLMWFNHWHEAIINNKELYCKRRGIKL